jgi:hypothetical protein
LDEQLTLKECLHDAIKLFFLIILLLSTYNNLIMKILTNICNIIIMYSKSTIFNPINFQVSVLLTGNILVSYIDWYFALPYSVLYFQKKGAWTCSWTSSFVHEHFGIIRPH